MAVLMSAHSAPADEPQVRKPANIATESMRGRVVNFADEHKRRFGVKLDADARESMMALKTADGRLWPILKDVRGRAFYTDPRLRDFDYELLVRRFAGSPAVQIVRVYTLHDGKKFELDYWCDVCAIPMYELKACECCQGPTRLREQPVEPDKKRAK